MTPGRCPHANCGCAAGPPDEPCCSAYCANAARTESLPGEADPAGACSCGHEVCRRAQQTPRGGVEVTTATGSSGRP